MRVPEPGPIRKGPHDDQVSLPQRAGRGSHGRLLYPREVASSALVAPRRLEEKGLYSLFGGKWLGRFQTQQYTRSFQNLQRKHTQSKAQVVLFSFFFFGRHATKSIYVTFVDLSQSNVLSVWKVDSSFANQNAHSILSLLFRSRGLFRLKTIDFSFNFPTGGGTWDWLGFDLSF